MFIGEKGRLLLPHFMETPRLIVDGKYQEINFEKFDLEDVYSIINFSRIIISLWMLVLEKINVQPHFHMPQNLRRQYY